MLMENLPWDFFRGFILSSHSKWSIQDQQFIINNNGEFRGHMSCIHLFPSKPCCTTSFELL